MLNYNKKNENVNTNMNSKVTDEDITSYNPDD